MHMSLHSWLNPVIECGDKFNHGIDTATLALKVLIIKSIKLLILLFSLSFRALFSWGR